MSYHDDKSYGFTDNEIFGSVMQNKRFCKAIIRVVLPDVNVASVKNTDAQKELGTKSDKQSKSVRLDIAVKDQASDLYDLKMQVNDNHDIGPRMWYYQSSMDRDALDRGEPYTSLSRTYLIFLCAFDPFGKGKLRCNFHLYDDEDRDIQLKNSTKDIIINSKGRGTNDVDLLNLQKLVNDNRIEAAGVFKEIQSKIQEYDDDPKKRDLMRTAELRMKEETTVARREEQKNTVRVFKALKPDATVSEGLTWIRANTNVSLSDEEIKSLLKGK